MGRLHGAGILHATEAQSQQLRICDTPAHVSKAPLEYHEDKDELFCKASGLAYPVRDGIPVMLESEARQLTADEKLG